MSTPMFAPAMESKLRGQLVNRRARLETAIGEVEQPTEFLRLLTEVDDALSRLDGGNYGECEVCHTSVDEAELQANPTARYCLCELTPERQRALERDLDLAWHVQSALLPSPGLATSGWRTFYRYLPYGAVSGDYCDLIPGESGLYFMLGDVSGKGVAASLLMAHLNAALRALAGTGLPPQDIMERADQLLASSTLASHYATLVCGRATDDGEIEIVNAGHCAPMLVRANGAVETLGASGMPLGLGVPSPMREKYQAERITLCTGDSLLLYTDGLTEAANVHDEEYGSERLVQFLRCCAGATSKDMIAKCFDDLETFLAGAQRADDLTILALERQS